MMTSNICVTCILFLVMTKAKFSHLMASLQTVARKMYQLCCAVEQGASPNSSNSKNGAGSVIECPPHIFSIF